MTKPQFNNALGALNWMLQPNLPARFTGVTARVFPLKARMDVLRAFCSSYLNIADTIVEFQPSLPYVYLMVLNYGRMSAEIENLGWVSQHEVAFAVPIDWYRIESGKPVYVDSGAVCPFIFVDNELSLSTGREVYGWPKVMAWLEPEVSPWLENPRNDLRLMSLSTMLYPKLFAGERQRREVLLQIRQRPVPSFSQFPPDLANPLSPLMRLPTAMMNWLKLLGQAFEMATRLPLLGYGEGAVPPLARMLRQTSGSMNPFAPPAQLNQITLKQFRDAEHPTHVCYQAIVNSTIETLRFNGGSLLGEPQLLAGDPTGGFEILVHRYGAEPIIESLGLDVAREVAVDGVAVSALDPVLPFWVDVDLAYGSGKALCWRTNKSDWYTPSGPKPVEIQSGAAPAPGPSAVEEDGPHGHPYDTALGAALQDVAGPFEFPNATVRVMPLMADATKLATFCDRYLNDEVGADVYRFEPWGSYVYLVVTNFEEMSSAKANLGFWAEREVTFFIPVKWYGVEDAKKLVSVGLVPIYGFADSGTAAITSREVNGQPTMTSAIKSPPNSWLSESGPSAGENARLMTLETTVYPAIRLGQRAEWRTLIDIFAFDPLRYNDDVSWRAVADTWGEELLRDHRDKIARKGDHPEAFDDLRALAVELLANRQPINIITLKQFRDVEEPLCACYQALVLGRREIDVVYDLREIEETVHVGIHRFPSLPIVEKLGLSIKWTKTGAEAVDVLQPVRPFWMRVGLKDYLGVNLCWRIDTKWQREALQPFYFESAAATDVGRSLVAELDAEAYAKQRVRAAAHDWLREVVQAEQTKTKPGGKAKASEPSARLSRPEAAEAVELIDPQMAIDSILSKEWLHWGNPRVYQKLPEKPDFCIARGSIGERVTRDALFDAEDPSSPWPGWYSEEDEKSWKISRQ